MPALATGVSRVRREPERRFALGIRIKRLNHSISSQGGAREATEHEQTYLRNLPSNLPNVRQTWVELM